jgi:hypothetical protein
MPEPNIFYFCYDHNRPTGGNKCIYRHVDILNKHNYKAFVLHTRKDFKLTWFGHQTPIVDLGTFKKVFARDKDFIVLPEDLGNNILTFPGKKIIFNQNIYYGFANFGFKRPLFYPYLHPDTQGVMVVSEHSQKYMKFTYPKLNIFRVYNWLDFENFTFRPLRHKKKKIAFNPDKKPLDLGLVYHILQSRSEQGLNVLEDYEWVLIKDKSEREVSQILQESLIFIFLSKEEGLALMPLEAMACGCLVAAYGVEPLTEYLPSPYQFAEGDILGIVENIEAITRSFPEDISQWQAISETGRDVARQYSLQAAEESVIRVWETILHQDNC